MEYRGVALIIFYDKRKRILLQYRKDGLGKGEDWGFLGGTIEKGETPKQTLIREVREELNHELKEYGFIGKFIKTDNKRTSHIYVYISPLKDKLSRFKQLEGTRMRLFSLKEAHKLNMALGDNEVIQKLRGIL